MDEEQRGDALASLAIGLGTMRMVDLLEEAAYAAGWVPPKLSKSALAVALSVGGTIWSARGGWRRRTLIAGAAAGISSLVHAAERAAKYRADSDAMAVMSRRSLMRP